MGEDHTILADGDNAPLYVRCEGAASQKQKKAIVLVHGMPMNHNMWYFQITDLVNNDYYVVTPDLRGCGQSDKTRDDGTHLVPPIPPFYQGVVTPKIYTLKRWAQDLNKIIHDLDLKNIHLVGESMGGAVVMQYMTDYDPPETLVKQLTLVSAAGPNMGATMQSQLRLTDPTTSLRLSLLTTFSLPSFIVTVWHEPLLPMQDPHPGYDQSLSLMFPHIDCKPVINNVDILQWLKGMFDTFFRDAMIGGAWEMCQDHQDLMNKIGKITTPTRLIHGCWDPFVPFQLSKYTQQHLPGAALKLLPAGQPWVLSTQSAPRPTGKLVRIPFGGHGLFFEQIADFNAALLWP